MDSETRGCAAIAYAKGTSHRFYEDRFRLLTSEAPVVRRANRGQLFAVFDGISTAPKGMSAAQAMSDALVRFFSEPEEYPATAEGLCRILEEGNRLVHGWGYDKETGRVEGGCAGTLAWIHGEAVRIIHCGDTACYVTDGGEARLITTEDKEKDGRISNYFGIGEELRLAVHEESADSAYRVAIVSDGVTKACGTDDVGRILSGIDDPRQAAAEIVRLARSRGSYDDITALVIDVSEMDEG